jgi:hypothetical protein
VLRVAAAFVEEASGDPCVLGELELARAGVARAAGAHTRARKHHRRAARLFRDVEDFERAAAAGAQERALLRGL